MLEKQEVFTQGEVEEMSKNAHKEFDRAMIAQEYTPQRDADGNIVNDEQGDVVFVRTDKDALQKVSGAMAMILSHYAQEAAHWVMSNDLNGTSLEGELSLKLTLNGVTRAGKIDMGAYHEVEPEDRIPDVDVSGISVSAQYQ